MQKRDEIRVLYKHLQIANKVDNQEAIYIISQRIASLAFERMTQKDMINYLKEVTE